MRKLIACIPNTLTCMNLACGCVAVVFAFQGEFRYAMYAIFAAAVFDFSDGFAARLLKAYSAIGKDLDSLADLVSFGLAPGAMLYVFMNQTFTFFPVAIAIPVLSALRLAIFNNDASQSVSFKGLPVPAHAIFWASLTVSLYGGDVFAALSDRCLSVSLIALNLATVLISLLLVSRIPMFSLKIKSLRWNESRNVYILAIVAILLFAFFGTAGIAASVAFYVLLSLFTKGAKKD